VHGGSVGSAGGGSAGGGDYGDDDDETVGYAFAHGEFMRQTLQRRMLNEDKERVVERVEREKARLDAERRRIFLSKASHGSSDGSIEWCDNAGA